LPIYGWVGSSKGEGKIFRRRVGMSDFNDCFHLPEEGWKLMVKQCSDRAIHMRTQEQPAVIRCDKQQRESRDARCKQPCAPQYVVVEDDRTAADIRTVRGIVVRGGGASKQGGSRIGATDRHSNARKRLYGCIAVRFDVAQLQILSIAGGVFQVFAGAFNLGPVRVLGDGQMMQQADVIRLARPERLQDGKPVVIPVRRPKHSIRFRAIPV
jgi:hypothetical protein